MGCSVSRPSQQDSAQTGLKDESAEKQWQQQSLADASIHQHKIHVDTDYTSATLRNSHANTWSANGLVAPSAAEHTTRALRTFSFVNGGLMGAPIPPPLDTSQPASNATSPTYLNSLSIRAYANEKDLLNAYYIYIHPYLPLLPPPANPQYEDCPVEIIPLSYQADRSTLPYWPTSSLGLALSAFLVLIPLPKEADPLSEPATLLRRSYAQLYAQSAEQALENNPDHRQSNMNMIAYPSTYALHQPSLLHPDMPANLEPILALLVLTVYDYCQRGNRKKMRARAHQALTAALDISLHAMGSEAPEAQKRAWWMTMYLASQASISNHSAPIMLIHDARITTPFPEFRTHHEPWELLMKAQDALMRAGNIAKELAKKRSKTNLLKTTAEDIRRLDSTVVNLGIQLDTARCVPDEEGAEPSAGRNLRAIALLFVHTARIKLHRFIAFGDYPLLLDQYNNTASSSAPSQQQQQMWTLDVDASFPFTAQQSTDICLRSALVVSRTLRHLPPPNPHYFEGALSYQTTASADLQERPTVKPGTEYPRSLPYLTCCTMQSCYVLVMLVRRLRASLCTGDMSTCLYLLRCAQAGTEIQDAERVIEEMRNGIGAVLAALKSDSIFEGIVEMARDVEMIYTAYFSRMGM